MTWTMKDLREAIRLRRAGWTYGHIAGVLGRPRDQVWRTVTYYAPDLVRPRPAFGVLAPRLRALHARGYTDAEVGSRLAIDPYTVRNWRRRLGLGSNRGHPRQREKCRRRWRALAHAAGKPHYRAVADELRRLRAAAAGWPDAACRQEVEVLDLLADRGPLTLRQLMEARGRANGSTRRLLVRLARRGLVAWREQSRRGRRGGQATRLYRLADGVGRHRTHVCHRVRGEEGVGP